MSSEAAKRATAKYQRDKMESISIRVKRDEGLYNRIKQAATVQGVKPAQFIKQALLNALDGPQPAQATQPQPTTPPAASTPQPPEGYTLIPDRPGLEPIKVLLPVDKRYNQRIYAAVKQGRAPSGAMYVMAALDKQLAADEADEKRKLDLYFAAMDDDY